MKKIIILSLLLMVSVMQAYRHTIINKTGQDIAVYLVDSFVEWERWERFPTSHDLEKILRRPYIKNGETYEAEVGGRCVGGGYILFIPAFQQHYRLNLDYHKNPCADQIVEMFEEEGGFFATLSQTGQKYSFSLLLKTPTFLFPELP